MRSIVNLAPLFLVGTQRSGTTLLARILNAHPKVYIKNELPVQEVFTPNCSREGIVNKIVNHVGYKSVESLLHEKNMSVWGVKDPQLTYYLNDLKQFIPASKFIFIVRDGRAVVNSYLDNKWGLGTNVYTGAQRWALEVKIQNEFCQNYANNCLLVKFEDLIADVEETSRRICAHIGLEYVENMINYHKEKSYFALNKQSINTNKRPDEVMVKKWQNKFTKRQIGIIEQVAHDELRLHGYASIGEEVKLPELEKRFYQLHQLIVGEIQLQYQLKRVWFNNKIKRVFNAK